MLLNHGITVRMMTSSNGNIFRVTSPLCGEFTGPGEFPTQRPVTRSFDVFFDLRLNKPLNKQSWGWWFETLSRSLWRHRNDICMPNWPAILNINHLLEVVIKWYKCFMFYTRWSYYYIIQNPWLENDIKKGPNDWQIRLFVTHNRPLYYDANISSYIPNCHGKELEIWYKYSQKFQPMCLVQRITWQSSVK